MRRHFALMLLGLSVAFPAAAESAPALTIRSIIDTPQWTTCFVLDRAAGKKWVSGIFEGSATRPINAVAWVQYVRSKFGPSPDLAGACVVDVTREDAIWRHAVFTDEDPAHPTAIVEVADWAPDFERRVAIPEPSGDLDTIALAEAPEPVSEAPAPVVADAETRPVFRIADEAEFQRQFAQYQLQLAEQQRQVEAFKQAQVAVARRKEAQRLAAAKAVAAYAVELHAHEETIRRHDAEIARYQAQLATTTTAAIGR